MGMVMHVLEKTKFASWKWQFISGEQIIRYGSEILIIGMLFLVILLAGNIARGFLFNLLLNVADNMLKNIPFVSKVYKTAKEIIKTLFITEKNSFKQVVMVPFPCKDLYCIGLVSRKAPKTCSETLQTELVSVFVLTAPNPATGYTIMCKPSDIIYLEMKTEEAVKFVISCGVITPEKVGKAEGEA